MSQSLAFNYVLTKTDYVFQFYVTAGMLYSLVVENMAFGASLKSSGKATQWYHMTL